ncbi:hypothetical protein AB0D14_13230 [Streptomyces sp. NPDC048484]|uniref:hypothetical protein n=1 Tax=Streptomyces sp. NPDC048484 TaxID=3155146 RepID=UPI003446F154
MTADLASVPDGARVMPVLTASSATAAGPPAEALAAGGARCAEVAFRPSDAQQVFKTMATRGNRAVGAGTVLTQIRRLTAAAVHGSVT